MVSRNLGRCDRSVSESQIKRRTKVMRGIARASAALPDVDLCGTMRVRRVLVPDFAEEVDAICAREEGRPDRVHRRVAPTLPFVNKSRWGEGFWFSSKESSARGVGGAVTVPRSRNRLADRGTRRTQSRPRHAKSPNRQSRNCSKLFHGRAPTVTMVRSPLLSFEEDPGKGGKDVQ
jgi:hypothetical protein